VSKSKGRNQEDRHNPLEKNLQNQITIDSRTFFDSFAMLRDLSFVAAATNKPRHGDDTIIVAVRELKFT
jgi:hypothetical protein